jgi:uncharacterized damage-inducible protein DinB
VPLPLGYDPSGTLSDIVGNHARDGTFHRALRERCSRPGAPAGENGMAPPTATDSVAAMAWTAPDVERREAEHTSDERTSLEQWLDYHRATLLHKCAGLTGDQLKQRSVAPSTLSLLGLVRHMTEVERWWFRVHAAGEDIGFLYCTDDDENADFDALETADAASDLAAFGQEVDACRAAAAGKALHDVVTCSDHGHRRNDRDIRWIYQHMIEEYARHNGHADLIRECIDGSTGE